MLKFPPSSSPTQYWRRLYRGLSRPVVVSQNKWAVGGSGGPGVLCLDTSRPLERVWGEENNCDYLAMVDTQGHSYSYDATRSSTSPASPGAVKAMTMTRTFVFSLSDTGEVRVKHLDHGIGSVSLYSPAGPAGASTYTSVRTIAFPSHTTTMGLSQMSREEGTLT